MTGSECGACGHDSRAGMTFCENCGESLATGTGKATEPEITCPACGHDSRAGVTFCESCGRVLVPAPAPKPALAPPPPPAAAAPRRIGRRIAAAVAALVAVGAIAAAVGWVGLEQSAQSDTAAPSSPDRAEPSGRPSDPGTTTPQAPATGSTDPPVTTAPTVPVPSEAATADDGAATDDGAAAAVSAAASSDAGDPPPDLLALIEPGAPDEGTGAIEDQVEGIGGFGLTADYRGYNKDSDFDGLSDGDETDLIEWFKPLLIFDEEEYLCLDPEREMAALYQVSPIPSGAVISFVAAYDRDCGLFGLDQGFLEAHPGDTEAMWIYLGRSDSGWYFDSMEIKRHFDDPERYEASELRFYTDDGGVHPKIWVSESKHAAYTSAGECEWYAPEELPDKLIFEILNVGGWLPWADWVGSYTLYIEDCGGGPAFLPYTPFEANVGEAMVGEVKRGTFDRVGDSKSVRLATLYYDEMAWLDTGFFCGLSKNEVVVAPKCAGGLTGKWKTGIDYVPTVESPTVDPSPTVTANIQDVWLEHQKAKGNQTGVLVHTAFSVDNNYQPLDLRIRIRIWSADGSATYSGTDPAYHTDAGQLAVLGTAATNAGAQRWGQSDYSLFLPYDEFFPGEQSYWAEVRLETPSGALLDGNSSEASPGFTVTRSGALTGTWQYSVGDGCCYTMVVNATGDPNFYSYQDGSGTVGGLTIDGHRVSVSRADGSFYTTGRITHLGDGGWPSRIEWDTGVLMWR